MEGNLKNLLIPICKKFNLNINKFTTTNENTLDYLLLQYGNKKLTWIYLSNINDKDNINIEANIYWIRRALFQNKMIKLTSKLTKFEK